MNNLQKTINFTIIFIATSGACYAAPETVAISPFLKFLSAMLGVFISAAAIFIALRIYKKITIKNPKNADDSDYSSLQSPKNFKEAINIFLDKTDR